ncbi:DUF7266 family protein [Halorientalis pallida]|uniref:DUF7266 family protein n=1 Tax=Halorientalis pallida TaxID=2479928 RepID=UPI003C6F408F
MIETFRQDDRAFSTVVEKILAIGLVTLFVSLVSVTVYGGVVPDARTAAGEQLSERTLATAAERVQQAVPPNATAADVRVRVDLPPTIRGAGYEIRAENRSLVLDHPRDRLDERARLALPESVVRVEGRWGSGETTVVRVRRVDAGLVVRLETGVP